MTLEVPQRPADLERLWSEALPLSASELPAWLDPVDAKLYRRIADLSARTLSLGERERLEEVGLIVDGTGVYVSSVGAQPVWSIGICEFHDLTELGSRVAGERPVVTRDDVCGTAASFVADPFLLRANRSWHVFFELYDWRANKGEIALATSADGCGWRVEGVVLAEDIHLSYPYVFEWRREHYLVPESHQAREVRLYRARRFPYEWSFAATLLNGAPFVDASIFRHRGRWWVLAGAADAPGALRLFGSDNLLDGWVEHPQSPVVAGDPSRARPAGRVITYGSRLIRFAQDCSGSYGTSVRAFEIHQLSASDYAERELPGWTPLTGSGIGWKARGIHHLDAQPLPGGRWLAAFDGWYDPFHPG